MDRYAGDEEAGKAGGGAGSGQVEASAASITPSTFPRGTPAPYLLTIIVAKFKI